VHQTRVGTFPGSAAPVTVQVTEPSRRRTGCVFVAFEWGQRHGINSGSKCNFAGECAFQTPNGSLCNLRLGSKNWKYSDERSEGNNRRHLPFLPASKGLCGPIQMLRGLLPGGRTALVFCVHETDVPLLEIGKRGRNTCVVPSEPSGYLCARN